MKNKEKSFLLKKLEEKIKTSESLLKKQTNIQNETTLLLPLSNRLEKFLKKQDLLFLLEAQRRLNSELNLEKLARQIVDFSIEFTQGERGFLILQKKERTPLFWGRNIDHEDLKSPENKVLFSIIEEAQEKGHSTLSISQPGQSPKSQKNAPSFSSKAILCFPFPIHPSAEGILYVDRRIRKEGFSRKEEIFLEVLGQIVSVLLNKALLYEENEEKKKTIQELNCRLMERLESQSTELEEIRRLLSEGERRKSTSLAGFLSQSSSMKKLTEMIEKVKDLSFPLLIQGESGTGKELIARALHSVSLRKDHPFLSQHSATLSETLLESELFGYQKGAFTGAEESREGLFLAAGKGTLFLDEIGDLSLSMQKKLLRVLQEHEVRPLGSSETFKVEARIIGATNRNLEEMVEKGIFSSDLYYRWKGIILSIPPLRERREDIPLLLSHFLEKFTQEKKISLPKISRQAKRMLVDYPWPGNVREVETEVRRWIALEEKKIESSTLSHSIQQYFKSPADIWEGYTLSFMEKNLISRALQRNHGNKSKAAKELGMDRTTLYAKMEKYNIEKGNKIHGE